VPANAGAALRGGSVIMKRALIVTLALSAIAPTSIAENFPPLQRV